MDGNQVGAYLPTTQVWDIPDIQKMDVNSSDFKELIVRLYQNIGNITQATNGKDTGIYDTSEFVCGQLFFPNPNPIAGQPNDFRQVYRKVINTGTLPTAGVPLSTIAHNITLIKSVTRIYGAATDPAGTYIPLPYVAAAGNNIALWADNTNVYINALGTDRSSFTISYVILEYVKQ